MWQRQGQFCLIVESEMQFLLCRPEGGLNDILSEIGKCLAYCQRFNRTLIVETNSQDSAHFKDVFGHYFKSTAPNLILDAQDFRDDFDAQTVLPHALQGRVNSYSRENLFEAGELNSSIGIGFDFSQQHEAKLLVHHQNGRQKKRNAMIALGQMKLQPELCKMLSDRLDILSANYTSFHVRHTDYKTDYKPRILRIAPHIKGPIFLATDNREVVEFFCSVFGSNRIFNFSELPEVAGKPVHYSPSAKNMRRQNHDAILDLFTLTLASAYYFFPRETGKFEVFKNYSGFSRLAARLKASPNILQQVLPPQFHAKISKRVNLQTLRWRYF
jgi:hypothetical protein